MSLSGFPHKKQAYQSPIDYQLEDFFFGGKPIPIALKKFNFGYVSKYLNPSLTLDSECSVGFVGRFHVKIGKVLITQQH